MQLHGLALGCCEPTTGNYFFIRLVDQVMTQELYCSTKRVV